MVDRTVKNGEGGERDRSECVSVKYRRPNYRTDHDQIWHACVDRPGDGSYLKKLTPQGGSRWEF